VEKHGIAVSAVKDDIGMQESQDFLDTKIHVRWESFAAYCSITTASSGVSAKRTSSHSWANYGNANSSQQDNSTLQAIRFWNP
jgi:hypothetical protein